MTDRQAKAVTMRVHAVIEQKRIEKAKQMIAMMQAAADTIFEHTHVSMPNLGFPLDLITGARR